MRGSLDLAGHFRYFWHRFSSVHVAFATRVRSLLMMLWLGLVTGFGSLWFVVFGNFIARATHPEPTGHAQPGQTIEALSPVVLSSGVLLAPTLALLFYWIASSFVSERKF